MTLLALKGEPAGGLIVPPPAPIPQRARTGAVRPEVEASPLSRVVRYRYHGRSELLRATARRLAGAETPFFRFVGRSGARAQDSVVDLSCSGKERSS